MPGQDNDCKFPPAKPHGFLPSEELARQIVALKYKIKEAQLAEKPLRFKRLRAEAVLPKYQTPGSAGFDLHAVVNEENPFFTMSPQSYGDPKVGLCMYTDNQEGEKVLAIFPGERCIVPTGWAVAIPPGYEMQIRPRSGLAAKQGITVLNAPGTIDSDYRGEVCVILHNADKHVPLIVRTGDRIAQAVLAQAEQFAIIDVPELDDTVRGQGGFGSTGA